MKMIFSLHLLNVAYSIETHETVIIIITIIKRNITQKKKTHFNHFIQTSISTRIVILRFAFDIITVTCDQDTP